MKVTTNKILTIIMGILILIGFFALGMAYKEGNECIANPLTYGADKLSSTETGEFSCSCSFSNPKYEGLYFNKDNISTLTNYQSNTQLKGGNIN